MLYQSSPAQVKNHPVNPGQSAEVHAYLRTQLLNAKQQQQTIGRIDVDDFVQTSSLPRPAHFHAVNKLLAKSSTQAVGVLRMMEKIALDPKLTAQKLAGFHQLKEMAKSRLGATEKIWAFYRDLFEQRNGPFRAELAAIDGIAVDCYQACFMGLGKATSIPTPPPLTYIDASTGPATYRRGVRVSRIARNPNPFPLIKLPYSRILSPWTLGCVPHEVGHNLQNDLKLWKAGPKLIKVELQKRGLPQEVQHIWSRWHKEIYADLIGVLLIGPAYVQSLMDVVGKSAARVALFRQDAAHPTPIIRPLISNILLRRIGFDKQADENDRAWTQLYPARLRTKLPAAFRRHFRQAAEGTVECLVWQPDPAYGGKRLVDVVCFRPHDRLIVNEAARRLASGSNPGVVPKYFLIAAARVALRHKYASPTTITRQFYSVLNGR